ncbi:MAG: translation elongation factor Ts [Omnitrophica bacterium RIFCSPLOWO2_01_FULL_45_24]|nr:MAG: translation elongation factor Ts [Omnitrophica bacterium RIFCSPHIGHO2_02_FULL_46_20]OGW94653.1 MAG: translation elongation factor Ts [Omnitrophica bacterium RIFCSPLOWO2_01_FULL_45_24]
MMDAIKKLRDKTSAGIVDCKKALKESGGDIDKAIEILRKRGAVLASKKAGRTAKEGRIESYIHLGGKIGVLVEVNCESDFVARNDDFKAFVKDIAMQIAASSPLYLKKEDVPAQAVKKETEIIRAQLTDKPAAAIEKITEGKLNKFFEDICLLEQPFIKDANLKVKDVLTSMIAKIGENIVIKRFARYLLGEEI